MWPSKKKKNVNLAKVTAHNQVNSHANNQHRVFTLPVTSANIQVVRDDAPLKKKLSTFCATQIALWMTKLINV